MIKDRIQPGFVLLLLIAASLACQLTSPTPASWSGTPTAQALAETNTRIAQTQQASRPEFPTITPLGIPTEVHIASTPTLETTRVAQGPWIVYPAPTGSAIHAYDVEAKTILTIDLPEPIYSGDLETGLSPDGKKMVIRAGSPLNTDELALYQIALPDTTAEKLTPLLSIPIQRQIINQDEMQAVEVFQAVTQPDGLAWSPNGRYLAFSGVLRYESANLYVIDTVNDQVVRLTGRFNQNITPFWSPDSSMLIAQELAHFDPDSGWQVKLVSGLILPLFDQQEQLYTPTPDSLREIFLGWINPANFLSYSHTPDGPHTIRQVNIERFSATPIFEGPFELAVFDPLTKSLAFTLGYQNAAEMGMVDGVYLLNPESLTYKLLRAGSWKILSRDPQGMFIATGLLGVYAFTPDGQDIFLPGEANLRQSPQGNWLIAWGDGVNSSAGARLYRPPADHPLQTLIESKVEIVFWEPETEAFFLQSGGTLYHLAFPSLNLSVVESGFPEGQTLELIWVD